MNIKQTIKRITCLYLLLCVAGCFCSATIQAQEPEAPVQKPEEEEKLPKLEEMKLPTASVLLQKPPVDWIILKNKDVLVVRPIYPRPNTLKKLADEMAQFRKLPRPEGKEAIEERKRQYTELLNLTVELAEGDDRTEYQIEIKQIAEIVHHEDLLIRRINAMLDNGIYRTAHEMFFNLVRSIPNWPGIKETQHKLLFLEAEEHLNKKAPEVALPYLEDLHKRNPKYPELVNRIEEVSEELISNANADDDFERARYFLSRLQAMEPNDDVVTKWKQHLLARATQTFKQAEAANSKKEYDVAARLSEHAMEVWPTTPKLRDRYRAMNYRFQMLRVGVLHLPQDPTPYFLPTRAERRHQQLTTFKMFEVDSIDETAHFRSYLFEEWEPTDLGRRAHFKLRQIRPYWVSKPIITASAVVDSLQNMMQPNSPNYDERLGGYIQSLKVISPFEFQVQFTRVPLRVEPLFRTVVNSVQETVATPLDEQPAPGKLTTPAVLSKRFQLTKQEPGYNVYRRSLPEPDGVKPYHIAEITEIKQESHEHAIRALLREEVSVLPTIELWNVDRLKKDLRFEVAQYSTPITHVIQVNPRSLALKNREYRRALAYAINRKKHLAETMLRDPEMKYGRLISAPFPTVSKAYDTLVKLRPYDLPLAFALTLSAKKAAKGKLPVLKMLVPPDPVIQEAAANIVEHWSRIGIKVVIVNNPKYIVSADSANWDIVYRTVQMAEPVTDLWPFLVLEDRARVESLRHLPDWLRQELIKLENVGNFEDAKNQLHELHKDLQTEAYVFPLWEVDDFIVFNKNIQNNPPKPVFAYSDIEKWIQVPLRE